MSFIYGEIKATLKLSMLTQQVEEGRQNLLREVAYEGFSYLQAITPVGAENDPKGDPHLIDSETFGYNQVAVWFVVTNPHAAFQEFGYHDRGGGWHEGKHFMQRTEQAAALMLRTGARNILGGGVGFIPGLPYSTPTYRDYTGVRSVKIGSYRPLRAGRKFFGK